MFKLAADEVWAFDAEWVPDPLSGRMAYGCDSALSDEEVVAEMWKRGGATEQEPRPYLKTVLCRVVSVAAVVRRRKPDRTVKLELVSLPRTNDVALSEGELLSRFLTSIGKSQPQLVGYNSTSADIPALFQRALANGLHLPQVCKRPNKPWEGVDYFAKGSDYNVDLKDVFGGWGKVTPSLHEIATACGIPGKMDADGAGVADLWREGRVRDIVQYNEHDALTTYLLWLRAAHLGGFVTPDEYDTEQEQLAALLRSKVHEPENGHLRRYLDQWNRLRELRQGGGVRAIDVSVTDALPAEDAT